MLNSTFFPSNRSAVNDSNRQCNYGNSKLLIENLFRLLRFSLSVFFVCYRTRTFSKWTHTMRRVDNPFSCRDFMPYFLQPSPVPRAEARRSGPRPSPWDRYTLTTEGKVDRPMGGWSPLSRYGIVCVCLPKGTLWDCFSSAAPPHCAIYFVSQKVRYLMLRSHTDGERNGRLGHGATCMCQCDRFYFLPHPDTPWVCPRGAPRAVCADRRVVVGPQPGRGPQRRRGGRSPVCCGPVPKDTMKKETNQLKACCRRYGSYNSTELIMGLIHTNSWTSGTPRQRRSGVT